VNYNLSNGSSHSLNSFPGIEGNTFTRGQSVMIGLTQNWTKTFLHTSQFYFSRKPFAGLNEFSNLTDISCNWNTDIEPIRLRASTNGFQILRVERFASFFDRSQAYRMGQSPLAEK